jgi:hypothetical protein
MRKLNVPKYYPSKYKTKAEAVLDMLKGGETVKQIKNRMAVSDSYIYAMKKQLAEGVKEAVEEKIEPKPEPEVSGVGKVLDARAEQYGSFMKSSDTAVKIKGAIHNALARNDTHLFPDQMIALDMIALKISRIVNGNAAHLDSWIDIAGYATLVADRLQGKTR